MFETADAHLSPKKWAKKKNLVRMPKNFYLPEKKSNCADARIWERGYFFFTKKKREIKQLLVASARV